MTKIGDLHETKESTIKEKLKYLGLDLNNIPNFFTEMQNLNYKVIKNYDEKQYKKYKFINVNDIIILLSPTNRMDSVKDKYEQATPLCYYLDSENEENYEKYNTFIQMLKKIKISEINQIEEEQIKLSKKIPFKVKFNGNYLWQIYYSESLKKYFMIVPTEDKDYSTFFYLLKKQLEGNTKEEIFVPISYEDYSGEILKKTYIKDIENYLWLFTKDYPSIYEVTDKKGQLSLQIIGETQIFEKVRTLYKLKFETPKEAMRFYKLLKALFILQTELHEYFEFNTSIDNNGKIIFYYNNIEIKYENILNFIEEQYLKSISLKKVIENNKTELKNKLLKLKEESIELEQEYLEKEKQISTFLECKKTFFGKMKYFFKVGKKSKKNKDDKELTIEEESFNNDVVLSKQVQSEDRKYTLDELVKSYKELLKEEEQQKNNILDINALKLKNKNLKKKIQNATAYIDEINQHKKSIFEFWKYSNKDAVATLEEGEREEIHKNKIEKIFNFEDEFEKFGENIDKEQRKKFTDMELESLLVANTDALNLMNRMYKKEAENREFSEKLRILKKEKELNEDEIEVDENEFNIFGKLSDDLTKEKSIGNKTHREIPRNIYQILNIKKETRGIEFKRIMEQITKNTIKAIKKNQLKEDIYAYKVSMFEMDFNDIEKLSLDINEEMEKLAKKERTTNKIYLYKIMLRKGTNYAAFSNIIFFDNKNMTLPVGMNFSNNILVNFKKMKVIEQKESKLKKAEFKDENNEFSEITVKDVEVKELYFE